MTASTHGRGERVRERRFALFLLLSLVVHGIALYEIAPRLRALASDGAGERGTPLVARIAPPTVALAEPQPVAPPPPPAAAAPPPAPKPSPPRVARAAPRPAPPVVAAPSSPLIVPTEPLRPLPETPPIARLEPAPPLPAPPAPEQVAQAYPDLASYVAAKRRARGASPESYEDENSRRDLLVARNLAPVNSPTLGDTRHSGGLFEITRLGYEDAEFTFFGWHTQIRRRLSQRIEVRRGDERDIRIAVVRRMIAIIRQYEQEDFTWRSNRLGREVTLSARTADSAGLEDFLMREFFF